MRMRKPPKSFRSRSTSRAVAAHEASAGAEQAGGDGREQKPLFHISVFQVGGQGGESGGEKVQQIDALSQVLVQSGQGGHIDQQKGAAPHAEAGQDPGSRPHQQGDQPAAHNRHLRPPQMSRAPKPRFSHGSRTPLNSRPPAQPAHSAADEIGQGGGEIQSAPEEIDGCRQGAQGQDDRH